MGKPRMIILIRHAQSEGNKNREIHQTVPDHRVKLTPEGHRQAKEAGRKLRALLRPDDTIHFFTSPYRRTRETTEGILESLTSDSPSPSPFPRHTIKVYEEPRLREQDFGNFQPCSVEMERMWLERADYGHFFYRIPNGESAADAYDRVSGFNESLWRSFGEDDFASVCVLVTHGLMTRVFLMKWYHWSVEYFEDLRNVNHCEFVIMKLNPDNGKYALQNQLRTWSELRKEKEVERQRERANKPSSALTAPAPSPVPIRRKWGGCPDGCNHGLHRRWSARLLRMNSGDQPRLGNDVQSEVGQETAAPEPVIGDLGIRPLDTAVAPPCESTTSAPQPTIVSADCDITSAKAPVTEPPGNLVGPGTSSASAGPSAIPRRHLTKFHRDSEDHLLHPPRSKYALFHLGHGDGGSGGSLSDANSAGPSEDERDDRGTCGDRLDQHRPKASQDFAHDGDDEDNGKQAQRPRRTRSHRTPNHHSPLKRNDAKTGPIWTVDIASASTHQEIHTSHSEYKYEHAHIHENDHDNDGDDDDDDDDSHAALEAERQRDQSIRGSVY